MSALTNVQMIAIVQAFAHQQEFVDCVLMIRSVSLAKCAHSKVLVLGKTKDVAIMAAIDLVNNAILHLTNVNSRNAQKTNNVQQTSVVQSTSSQIKLFLTAIFAWNILTVKITNFAMLTDPVKKDKIVQ
jgi:hypothetical protein